MLNSIIFIGHKKSTYLCQYTGPKKDCLALHEELYRLGTLRTNHKPDKETIHDTDGKLCQIVQF